MTVIEISDEIHRDLNMPTDVSVASITFWLRSHIGDLNNLLVTAYALTEDSSEFDPELGEEEKSIFKKLYLVHYYDFRIRENLGAAAQDVILEVSSDGANVRTVNRNELAKSYTSLRKMESDMVGSMVNAYRRRGSAPLQVAGDDAITMAQSLFTNNDTRF
jgi:hypothetical protein